MAKFFKIQRLETITGYTNAATPDNQKITNKYGKAHVITAFNVFAHNDDLKDILDNVEFLHKKMVQENH